MLIIPSSWGFRMGPVRHQWTMMTPPNVANLIRSMVSKLFEGSQTLKWSSANVHVRSTQKLYDGSACGHRHLLECVVHDPSLLPLSLVLLCA
jgi:hypothetical protein